MARVHTYEVKRREGKATFPVDLHAKLLARAKRNNRSLSRELIDIVEKTISQEEQQKSI